MYSRIYELSWKSLQLISHLYLLVPWDFIISCGVHFDIINDLNMEIRPQAPKNGIFQNFLIFVEMSSDFASNEPSTTPDIKSKSSYARKRDFGLLCPNIEIRPQAPKNEIFQKIFIFLKKSSNFASNELSTTCRHKV